ncbi:hypothetical protein NADFUDRAFT_13315, partial [Nadsonia fulvescens var. elongata DSM 6958]
KRYVYAGIALAISLVTFIAQTESAGYLANTLNYKKPIFTLYLTHCSWVLLWPAQLAFLRIKKRRVSFSVFWSRHIYQLRTTALSVVDAQSVPLSSLRPLAALPAKEQDRVIFRYMLKSCLICCLALNVAGSSWYIAVNLTTPSDLTAIYNCSAFFAYSFSVLLLGEKVHKDKIFSVILAIIGVIIVAYTGGSDKSSNTSDFPYRTLGNAIIGVGSVLYGLYEVLYKKLACPPQNVSPRKQAIFANAVGSIIGFLNMILLWVLLPVLHLTGLERFELPEGEVTYMIILTVLSNAIFSGSFLVLLSLTSPVISSVAALITIFLVAIVDWLLFGTSIGFGGFIGGIVIVIAFGLLTYTSWQELN